MSSKFRLIFQSLGHVFPGVSKCPERCLGCKSFIQFLLDALSGGVLLRLHLVFQLLDGLLRLVFAVFGLPDRLDPPSETWKC